MILRTLLLCLLAATSLTAFQLPAESSICIVGQAKDWNSSTVTLSLFEKSGKTWQAVGAPWQGRLGKSGLVWGKGIHPNPRGATLKQEGDQRSPAGVFTIGGAWGDAASIRKHPELFYRQVTSRDLWVEDPASPKYNQHIVLDHEPASPWEKKQQMKQNDAAHSLKLFIAHNAPPRVTANAGSSIFFHVWRQGGSRATAGCTTMDKAKLQWLISKIDPKRNPIYVLLPAAEYSELRKDWKLP